MKIFFGIGIIPLVTEKMDGVHPTHNVQPVYGWIQKGVRKEIPANSGRSRINLSGVIDIIDHKVLVQEDRMLNAEATI